MVSSVELYSSNLNKENNPQGLPALILLHGLFGMGDNLSAVGRALADDFVVYRLDLRNHGRSSHANSMSFDEMAADVAFFMEQQNIETAAVLGHSLGGKVAMQLALNYPDKVSQLVVADISPVTYEARHNEVFSALKAVDLKAIKSRRDADEVLTRYIDEEMIRLFILKNLYRDEQGQFVWRLNVDAVEACYPQLCLGMVAETPFKAPTLFIKGEASAYIQDKHRATIMQLFPLAELTIIQGASHYLHAEKPAEFNAVVKEFLLD